MNTFLISNCTIAQLHNCTIAKAHGVRSAVRAILIIHLQPCNLQLCNLQKD